MTRKYSSISVETTLLSTISSSAVTVSLASATGASLMGGVSLAVGNVDQFTVAIDPDTINEEIVFITDISGDTITVVRGRAESGAIAHTAGATVRHVLTSDDLNFFTTGVATANGAVAKSTATTKGDIFVATASETIARQAIGSNGQVLVADSTVTNGLKWETPATVDLTISAKVANYTFVIADVNKLVTMSNAATTTFTVANGIFSTGQQINIQSIGAGSVQIRNDGTTTLTSTGATSTAPNLRAQFSAATIICTGTNTFTVIGDIA